MTERDIEKKARAKMDRSGWAYWFPPFAWKRERDIFGVFDFVAITPAGYLFVQLTSVQHISDRQKKIWAWEQQKKIILPTGSAEVWAWDKNKSKFVVRALAGER